MYDRIYYEDVKTQLIEIFEYGQDMLPYIDIEWMIKVYLKSEHRKHVEDGMPYYIAQLGSVVIRDMLKGTNYPTDGRRIESYGDSLYWMGMVYNYLFFKYNIPCSKLIDLITVSDMLKQYVTMHETGLDHTAEHLYEVFIEKDKSSPKLKA